MYSVLFICHLLGSFVIPLEAVIEEYLKPAVSPCDNFYEYACGKWEEVHTNVKHSDTLSLLDATINEKLSELMESKQKEEGLLEKVKTLYESCRNLQVFNTSLFLNFMKPQSDWTVSISWNEAEFNWLHTVAELKKYGVQIFLEQTILPRWDNASVNMIHLDILKFELSKEESIKGILQKASLNTCLAEEFILFEKQLAQIIINADVSEDKEFDEWEEVELDYVEENVPQIEWKKYFSTIFGNEIELYTSIIVQNLEAMSKLAEFLNTSQPRVVCNYIMIKFLQFLDLQSIEGISPRECAGTLHQAMPLAVDHIIENHFYDHDYDQVVQDLFNYLKVEFLAEVSKLYENEREVLLFIYTKASVMDLQIGNSDRNMTTEAIAKYYESLNINKDNFYFNVLEAFKFKSKKDLNSLKGEPINIAYQWTITPSPFFVQPKNRIIVPLSLLQQRMFVSDTTNKYSVLGFIIGHEFLHGFDTIGVNYDYTGSMVESPLSCNPSFITKIQCIETEMGEKGVGEKIADIGGIRLAYDAYRRSLIQIGQNIMENEGTARSLGQSFFIDFAQFFCGKVEKSPKRFPDIHDADELRIKRSLMNFNTFANDFECPIGSAMNPEKKCRVW